MRFLKVLALFLAPCLCFAAQSDRIAGTVDAGQMVRLPGHLERKALPQYDRGRLPSSAPINRIMLLTLPTASQQEDLSRLLAAQQDPKSSNFHKWLTPQQYAERFGLSRNDIQKISAWLESQGFHVDEVANGRNWITFSGSVAQVENAFRTELHRYNVNGEMHFANSIVPSVPAALAGIATGLRGLDDFIPKSSASRKSVAAAQKVRANYYSNNFQADFVAPGDIETIYDLTPLYSAGIDGTGEKLAVIGQTDVYLSDLNDFRSGFGLSAISGCTTNANGVITSCSSSSSNLQYVSVGTDPGTVYSCGDITEADLDLEWSGAVAKGAQIIYVNSPVVYDSNCNYVSGGGVFVAYYHAIDSNLAPVISLSYGAPCEFDDNFVSADEAELTKANSFGITFVNSSGDSGSASCDPATNSSTNPANLAVNGLAVSYPASSPEVTGVGGTAIAYPAGFSSTYWGTANPTNGGTAQNAPLPETSWNDDVELGVAFPGSFGSPASVQETYAIVQSGGGASNCSVQTSNNASCVSGFAKPSWQTVTIPGFANPTRFVPDVSLLGSPNFPGYIFCTPLDQWLTKSASTASSCAPGGSAGITAALALTDPNSNPPNQASPTVVGGTSASAPVFAAMVVLLNQYLGSNGLSNINPMLYQLAETPANSAFHPVTSGDNLVYCEGATPAGFPAAYQCPGASGTVNTIGYQASNADSVTGYNLVTGLGSVDANALFTAWAASSTSPNFTLQTTADLSPTSVPAGQSASATITIAPVNNSTQTINFGSSSCSGLPSGATCSFNPTSVTLDGTSSQTVTVTVTTAANMSTPATAAITVKGAASGTSGTSHTTTINLNVTTTNQAFVLTTTATTFPVAMGGTATVNVTVANPASGGGSPTPFVGASTALPLTYTCASTPALSTLEIACQVSPGNGQPTSATAVAISLVTTAKTAQLAPLGRSRIFYAMLLPGLFGVVCAAGSRSRGARLLSLIAVLGFSTLWMGACGGSSNNNSTQPNAGTPVGTYNITINATTGGANPLTASVPITLTVTQ